MANDMNDEWAATRELIVAPVEPKPTTMVRAAIGDVTDAIVEYTRIKTALDRALPDCIQVIQGKQFRKKTYWRAIATAFNLTLECREEKLDETETTWGYIVTYRATAPNGRFADGDGACFASEKKEAQATVHNVRSHAHTRAMNRAISNLVGFGEVSAEEVERDNHDTGRGAAPKKQVASEGTSSLGAGIPAPRPVTPRPLPSGALGTQLDGPWKISEPQTKRLWAIWSKRWEEQVPEGSVEAKLATIKNILADFGYESSKDIEKHNYNAICSACEGWLPPDTQVPEPSWEAR